MEKMLFAIVSFALMLVFLTSCSSASVTKKSSDGTSEATASQNVEKTSSPKTVPATELNTTSDFSQTVKPFVGKWQSEDESIGEKYLLDINEDYTFSMGIPMDYWENSLDGEVVQIYGSFAVSENRLVLTPETLSRYNAETFSAIKEDYTDASTSETLMLKDENTLVFIDENGDEKYEGNDFVRV